MKKMIFTLVLTIVSSVWMTSKAMCQVDACTCLFEDPPVAISGILQLVPLPCPESTEDIPCPPCLTIALNANEQLYYLNGLNDNLNALLDTLVYPVNATVTGHVYTALEGGLAISVQDISLHASLPSLCDEWNVLTTVIYKYSTRYFTFSQKLTTDTIIGENMYVKSEVEHKYNGAYREGENRDIYFVPAAMNKEFLVYAWNAQVGDTLYNILVSSYTMYGLQYSNKAVVREIKETTPRTFIVDYEYIYNRKIDSADTIWWEYQWIEGIGMTCGASGDLCPFDKCQDSIKSDLLCAYKNGEQVYSSSKSERYGCEFNGITSTKPYHLCDEWNVLEHLTALGPDYESFGTQHFRLTSDTMINETRYVRLEQDGTYKGALREGTNADIYYVPNNSTHEYLLYAFNAQVGDNLENLWFGANEIDRYIINSATVVNIESTTPRKFTIDFEWQSVYSYAAINDTSEIMHAELVWLEGIGFQFGGPLSYECPFDCAGGPGLLTLCAYKNGEQVYADPYWSEKIGCEYNRHTLNYLCDEWNVLYEPFSWPGGYNTFKYYLSTDTIINGKQYVKLASDKDYPYCGAFREDINANIYYIPSGSTHEYLLYAFNAQTGDTLSNLWVGGFGEGYQGVVQAISKGSPRIFTIGVKFYENSEYYYPIQWIEGVGSPETPMGLAVVPTVPADIGVFNLLCAYKNGQQVYATQLSERYGCFYEGRNPPPTTDTIPLYAQDDPGSSTVDPVDPNQVVATLQGDQLTIHESTGVDVTYSLNHTAPAQVPSHNRAPLVNTFQNKITIQITESGEYLLKLTNPSWGYTIFGQFYYAPQGIDQITNDPAPITTKVIKDGQLFILRGDKTYTLTGAEVK